MCSKRIVGLLSISILCWAGLPGAWGQSPAESYLGGSATIQDDTGSATTASLRAAAANLKARNPHPANGACGVDLPILSWTPGDTAVLHNVYIGRNPNLGPPDLRGPSQVYTAIYFVDAAPGTTYYWRVDEIEQNPAIVHTGDIWCFTTSPATPCPLVSPAGVVSLCCGSIALSWPADPQAVKYEVYLDDDWMAVLQLSPAAYQGSTTQTTFPVEGLVAGVTYYWCAHAVAADGTVQQSALWSFTTAACNNQGVLRKWWLYVTGTNVGDFRTKYASVPADGQECLTCFEGPTDWQDNYGSHLCAWLLPPASGEYTFWIASDDQSELWLSPDANPANVIRIAGVNGWTAPRQWDKEPGQQSAPITLTAGQRYYIEAFHKEGTGGDNIAVAWAGPGLADRTVICVPFVENPACEPLVAHSPYPADGDPPLAGAPLLSWQAGRDALEHDVYLSTDYELVLRACPCACSVYRGRQAETTYDPGPLAPGTYYWRVDEVNLGNPASPWTGCVWRFTIGDDCTLVLDDFESYTHLHPIQSAWTGTPLPVALEQTIVHGGAQSMRLDYDNRFPPYRSEAQPLIPVATTWTAQGATTLSLWFHGRSESLNPLTGNTASPLHVQVGDSQGRFAMVVHPDSQAVLINNWTRWQIPLQQFTGVDLTHLTEVAIGVGGTSPDGTGSIYIDDICLH